MNLPFPVAPPGDVHDFCKENPALNAAKIGAANDKRKRFLPFAINKCALSMIR